MDEPVCASCADFQPQAWRKSLCRNCFHLLEEHSGSGEGIDKMPITKTPAKSDPKAHDQDKVKTSEDPPKRASVADTSNSKQPKPAVSKGKFVTATISSSKFGGTVGKGKDTSKTDLGRCYGKVSSSSSVAGKGPSDSGKKPEGKDQTDSSKQTTDGKGTTKPLNIGKKLNGGESKSKTAEKKDVGLSSLKPIHDSKKTAKKFHSTDEEPKKTTATPRTGSDVSKVKHLLRSFGSEEESSDVRDEKPVVTGTSKAADNIATLSHSDVTAKCQSVVQAGTSGKAESSKSKEAVIITPGKEPGRSYLPSQQPSSPSSKLQKPFEKIHNGKVSDSSKNSPTGYGSGLRHVDTKVDNKRKVEVKGNVDLKSRFDDKKSVKEKEKSDSKLKALDVSVSDKVSDKVNDKGIAVNVDGQKKDSQSVDILAREESLLKEIEDLRHKVSELSALRLKETEILAKEQKLKDLEKKEIEIKIKESEIVAKEEKVKELNKKEQELLSSEKKLHSREEEIKSKEKLLKDLKIKESELETKSKQLGDLKSKEQLLLSKEKEIRELKSKQEEFKSREKEIKELKAKVQELQIKEKELRDGKAKESVFRSKDLEVKQKTNELDKLKKRLAEMEEKSRKLDEENSGLKKAAQQQRKDEAGKLLTELQQQLRQMEDRCSKLEGDNTTLLDKLQEQETEVRKDPHGRKEYGDLDSHLVNSAKECRDLESENHKLRDEIVQLRDEMDEMYDTFRENEVEEFRDLQKEMEYTAKNCRILQFKLRKAERQNEQLDTDRRQYEDRLRLLQSQFESEDARTHIEMLEKELVVAKEVSVRLHDELDVIEDKKVKREEENRHLTDLLEQTDKKQFRMEMEIDRLKDQIIDYQNEIKYGSLTHKDALERKTPIGAAGKQSSTEYDVTQLMRDLYDSIERENDLKEQLRFTEEETRMMRKKLGDLEEENESLNMQIRKMSKKANKAENADNETDQDSDTDSLISEADVRLQLDILEQDYSVLQKKMSDVDQENENLQAEVKFLQEHLEEKRQELSIKPEPSSPNSYYLDKMKQMNVEADDLRWKIIEKDREIDRLLAQVDVIQRTRQKAKLKKSKSLDSDYQIIDLKRQLDLVEQEADMLRKNLSDLETKNERLEADNTSLRAPCTRQLPAVLADDAAVENIELKDRVKRLDDENHSLNDKIKTLTESLQTLTKNVTARSPRVPDIPSPTGPPQSRDPSKQLELVKEENRFLRRNMAELQAKNSQLTEKQTSLNENDEQKLGKTPQSEKKESEGEAGTRNELLEIIQDMEDEIDDLVKVVKTKDADKIRLEQEVNKLRNEVEDALEESRHKQEELLDELELLHDKNSVLSNLLEIVSERAEAAEGELQQIVKEHNAHSDRSASAVSALSNASVGSDDVFLTPPSHDGKSGVIVKDWDNQIKKRMQSLERQLAEERLKVSTAQKKLQLVATEHQSTSLSDDSKLHLREKELLQEENIEHQKHLKIATDQIKGLRERLHVMEEEHYRLRVDYGRVCDELVCYENMATDSDKTPEGTVEPAVAKTTNSQFPPIKIPPPPDELDSETRRLQQECAIYKLKSEELEYKMEEIHDIWKSKSAASEKEKRLLETKAQVTSDELQLLETSMQNLKDELRNKEKQVSELEAAIAEKACSLARRDEIIQDQDDVIRQRDHQFQTLLDQISQRDENVRELRETIRNRDERLKEKDDILFKLNSSIDGNQRDIKMLSDKLKDLMAQLSEKDAVISVLQQQISQNVPRDTGSETDIEKENARLKEQNRTLLFDVQTASAERESLQGNLAKNKRVLDETILMWEKDKSSLEVSINIAEEKLRIYETFPGMEKTDVAEALRSDAQLYFKEKEELARALQDARKEHETNTRELKEVNAKLQTELTLLLKQVKAYDDEKSKMQPELERLRTQADMAYGLQQEERVQRAEHLAMKVRYETRFEKMTKDYSKMIVTVEKLQKERDLDKQIIQGIQKGMMQMKDNYTNDLQRWEEERKYLERQLMEIEESRDIVEDLRKKTQDMIERIADQERLRAEMINKVAMDRSSWEIERANMQSRINQMEEKLSVTSRAQTRAKDMASNMESAWETERDEQKHLLIKAHNLALDLQEQLKSRDEAFSRERKDLVAQFEAERQKWSKDRKDKERKILELESCGKKLMTLQKKQKDLQEKCEHEQDVAIKEKTELLHRLAAVRHAHTKDVRRVDDILTRLVRLKEFGTLIAHEGGEVVTSSAEDTEVTRSGSTEKTKVIDQAVVKYIKDALVQITAVADELSKHAANKAEQKAQLRRSLSSSELDLLKDELAELQEGGDVFVIPERDRMSPATHGVARNVQRSSSLESPTHDVILPVISQSLSATSYHSPSYASGSHSAHNSRSSTPEWTQETSHYESRKLSFPPPPPSILFPAHPASIKPDSQSEPKASRPRLLMKSASVDSPSDPSSLYSRYIGVQSLSADTTPTEPFLFPSLTTAHAGDSLKIPATASTERLSPRSARKKFFEERPVSEMGFMSWPERKPGSSVHKRQPSLPDPEDMRKVAEEDYLLLLSKLEAKPASQMKLSTSLDEKIHFRVNQPADITPTQTDSVGATTTTSSKSKSAKEKRRFFKKSNSVEGTVGTSIAKIGTIIMPAAPTGYTPPEFFSAIKSKFKHPFRKQKDGKSPEPRSPSPSPAQLSLETSVKEESSTSSTPFHSATETTSQPQTSTSKLSREEKKTIDSPREEVKILDKRWRSRSADRAVQSASRPVANIHGDLLCPAQVWQFNETAV